MIWFDLDNSPHVPLFRPIFRELDWRSIPYLVTARDFAQTKDLLEYWKITHKLVGQHGGKNKLRKIINLYERSQQLIRSVRNGDVGLAVSHGSRTQLLAARRLGIQSVLMLDYEYTESFIFNYLATHLLMPKYIPDERLKSAGFNLRKVIRYEGFKEEIYLNDFLPDLSFRNSIGINAETILITIRPPSTTGNYHDPVSEDLFQTCLTYFSQFQNTHCLIVNRTSSELNIIPQPLRNRENITILPKAVDGLQLIWNSDIVISGGGTMNRESALLGVPTYSIFTGKRPYLDIYLSEQNRLTFVETPKQIHNIPVKKRAISDKYSPSNKNLFLVIAQLLLDLNAKYQ
jgi:uncharacterized protein